MNQTVFWQFLYLKFKSKEYPKHFSEKPVDNKEIRIATKLAQISPHSLLVTFGSRLNVSNYQANILFLRI